MVILYNKVEFVNTVELVHKLLTMSNMHFVFLDLILLFAFFKSKVAYIS